MKKRRFSMLAGALVVLLGGGFWGYTSLKGASVDIDPAKIATVERGTMVRSVVATGKVEPVTRPALSSPSVGTAKRHAEEQKALIAAAFDELVTSI